MNRRNFIVTSIAALVAVGITGFLSPNTASAKDATVFTGKTPGIAINGYDAVAYHTVGKPVLGKSAHTAEWHGVKWQFSSAENLNLFVAAPEKYAPKYGGYCAYAVAKNSTAKTQPDAFTVVGGSLYLNYNQSVKSTWDSNQLSYIKAADKNWPGLSKK